MNPPQPTPAPTVSGAPSTPPELAHTLILSTADTRPGTAGTGPYWDTAELICPHQPPTELMPCAAQTPCGCHPTADLCAHPDALWPRSHHPVGGVMCRPVAECMTANRPVEDAADELGLPPGRWSVRPSWDGQLRLEIAPARRALTGTHTPQEVTDRHGRTWTHTPNLEHDTYSHDTQTRTLGDLQTCCGTLTTTGNTSNGHPDFTDWDGKRWAWEPLLDHYRHDRPTGTIFRTHTQLLAEDAPEPEPGQPGNVFEWVVQESGVTHRDDRMVLLCLAHNTDGVTDIGAIRQHIHRATKRWLTTADIHGSLARLRYAGQVNYTWRSPEQSTFDYRFPAYEMWLTEHEVTR